MNKNGNMTTGNPLKIIFLFSLPIFIGCIFQQLYNVVDTAVVGHVLGDNSLAAIGATAAIYNLVIGFANGLTNGFAVIIARMFGADDLKGVQKTVSLTYVLTLIISAILTFISLIGINPLLTFLNTPNEIFEEASLYLHIIMIFSIITMLYNMFSGMLRAIGNSTVPLIALISSTIINIILDVIFVHDLSMGIAGAAYATAIAQAVSVIVCLTYILRKCELLKFKFKSLAFDRSLLGDLISTGLSMGLMLGIVSIGSVALQSAVNSFGSKTITAHTTARKIGDIFMLPLGAISTAASTFASQNFGAKKCDRVTKGIKQSLLISFIWSAISCLIVFVGGKVMIKALTGTSDTVIITTALQYVTINVPFFFALSILLVLRSSLQGIGRKLVPVSASVVELIAKFAAVKIFAPALGYFGVCILEPIIWAICTLMVLFDFLWTVKKQRLQQI